MLPRIIPVLLLKGNGLYKGTSFNKHKYIGDPINTIKLFNDKMVDEITILDIEATKKKYINYDLLATLAGEAFMPLSYGGGVSDVEQIKKIFSLGYEKVILNSSIINNQSLISHATKLFGSQSIVVSADYKRKDKRIYINNGKLKTKWKLLDYVFNCQLNGAGEILLQCIDLDGTFKGYDLKTISTLSKKCNVPLIASCGAKTIDDMVQAVINGANAVSAGSMFVYNGPHKAVLIQYPKYSTISDKFKELSMEKYRMCTRCVMDTTASDITFDQNGVCNYCTEFYAKIHNMPDHKTELAHLVEQIKHDGKNKKYDCIVGVSGGVDSSYVLYKVKELGLRPLAVHLDNGWNTDLATKNIENLVTKLNVDLYTHVIDWEENKDLQLSMIKANVVDIEMLMDNAMFALNVNMAKKYGIKYILSGENTSTEGMRMPPFWNHHKKDKKNIVKIHKKYGKVKIKTHLLISIYDWIIDQKIFGIKWLAFLDYLEYNKYDAISILQEKVSYIPYKYKHNESVFTRFYQNYILPEKFHIDKRKLHLSTLIITKQITREQALKDLKNRPYEDIKQEESDKEFVLKKLDIQENDFKEYIMTPGINHDFYGTELTFFRKISQLYKRIKGLKK